MQCFSVVDNILHGHCICDVPNVYGNDYRDRCGPMADTSNFGTTNFEILFCWRNK